jgi:ATP synthase protein I
MTQMTPDPDGPATQVTQVTRMIPSGPGNAPPFARMLRASVVPMLATGPVIVLVFWVTREAKGGLAALLGAAIAMAFFASGLYVMGRVTNANPLSVLAGALAVYLGQVIALGVVIVSLSGADWLDRKAFGLSILVVALVWQLCQVVAFMRLRKPVYDEPAEPAPELDERPIS